MATWRAHAAPPSLAPRAPNGGDIPLRWGLPECLAGHPPSPWRPPGQWLGPRASQPPRGLRARVPVHHP
eukprot:9431700-Pyramimonas_sp.AAC.1